MKYHAVTHAATVSLDTVDSLRLDSLRIQPHLLPSLQDESTECSELWRSEEGQDAA